MRDKSVAKHPKSAHAGNETGGNDVALRVREEIARRRWSRQTVADKAGISLSTLEKALSGRRPFTLATVVRLEALFNLPLRAGLQSPTQEATSLGIAPDEFGSYNRAAVAWLEGAHLTIRPSFSDPKAVYAYRTDVTWDAAHNRLAFREAERTDTDFTQFGFVAVPHQSGHIYFVTNRHGQHRLITMSKPTITGEMHGILSTLQAGRGAHLTPIATPIVMAPITTAAMPAFGKIGLAHPAHAAYTKLLRRTLGDHFAAFLTL